VVQAHIVTEAVGAAPASSGALLQEALAAWHQALAAWRLTLATCPVNSPAYRVALDARSAAWEHVWACFERHYGRRLP
jgi:hypothetical protein